ncbi:hypothetical protein KFK09_001755 [Dendrobium nobile]|uniref:DUF4283 domain-containing protein n=1 Tax=Dendrobium nobile TaxID=94219 RepID=A0A8T3C8C0_DENNO|nr:hypothetical protein KFK09_001755 [Dendrobium nobile]
MQEELHRHLGAELNKQGFTHLRRMMLDGSVWPEYNKKYARGAASAPRWRLDGIDLALTAVRKRLQEPLVIFSLYSPNPFALSHLCLPGITMILEQLGWPLITIKGNYNCLSKAAANVTTHLKPILAWVDCNLGMWTFSRENYKLKVLTSLANSMSLMQEVKMWIKQSFNHSFNVSNPDDMDDLYALLFDVVIDQIFAPEDIKYNLLTFLDNFNVSDDANFDFLINQSMWRYDKRVQNSSILGSKYMEGEDGKLTWFNAAVSVRVGLGVGIGEWFACHLPGGGGDGNAGNDEKRQSSEGAKLDDSPPKLEKELKLKSAVSIKLNSMFNELDSSMEVEEIDPIVDCMDDMEEIFDVNAAMPGWDCTMEVSSNLAVLNDVVVENVAMDGGSSTSVVGIAVVEAVGVTGAWLISSGLSNPSCITRDVSRRGNAWRKPEHIPILHPEEIIAISADSVSIDLNLEIVKANMAMLEHAEVGENPRKKCFILLVEVRDPTPDAILCGGPWFIGGNLVELDRWTPCFSLVSMEGLSSPVWIQLPNLALHYWDDCNISRIALRIGIPLWIDAQIENWGRREHARVCVRMNFANKLQVGIWVNGLNGRFY